MTVPVSESSEEQNLRRLVDAINANANAETANTGTSATSSGDNGGAKSSASNGSSGSSSRSGRTPTSSKSPRKRDPRNEDPAPVQVNERSPPRKTQQQLHVSPKSGGRSRARNNDAAAAAPARAREDVSPAPKQGLGSRRAASWTGIAREKEKRRGSQSSKGQEEEEESAGRPHIRLESHLESAATGAATNTTATETRALRGQAAGEEEEFGRGVLRGSASRGEGEERAPAGVGVGGERGSAMPGRPQRSRDRAGVRENIGARPGHGEEEEESLPIEDRLQAVMKDLGVPSGGQG